MVNILLDRLYLDPSTYNISAVTGLSLVIWMLLS